jgi:hypothetical protein
MNTFTDSRLITISADSADQINNGTLLSSCVFNFPGLLKDETDILYTQISVQNAQIPISYYVVNIYNNVLKYSSNNGPIQTAIFSVGNYNANTFITEFQSKIPHFSVVFNRINGKFTINSNHDFQLLYSGSTCFKILGLDINADYSSTSKSLSCPYPCQFQGITRIKIVSSTLSTYSLDAVSGGYTNTLACISVNSGAYGILLYQNTSQFKPLLRDKILDGFDIELLDDDENRINFNNVSWHITLQLDIIRKLNIVDKTFPPIVATIPDTSEDTPQTEEAKQGEEINKNIEDIPLPSTGDDDLDFLMYQNGIYQ